MGFSEVAASAPSSEDARKYWLKVTYEGRARMVEWNTNLASFKDLEIKVKKMFGLSEKQRVVVSYEGVEGEILMSSDEELSSALHFLQGEVLLVKLTLERKKKKSVMARTLRAAKAQRPVVMGFLTNLPANLYARMPHVNLYACAERMRAAAQGFARCACPQRRQAEAANAAADASGNAAPAQQQQPPHRPNRSRKFCKKLFWCLFFLVFAVFAASHFKRTNSCHQWYMSRLEDKWHEYKNTYHSFKQPNHVTILNANYGGKDVTRLVQDYYNKHGEIKTKNSLFGDPAYGSKKFLHVVYQHFPSQGGLAEVYSQSFPESEAGTQFSMERETCAYPEEAIVDGRSVKILGALYDDVSATCAARRFAATGRLSSIPTYYGNNKDSTINRNHFGSNSPYGLFSLVYLKDNQLRTFVGREGNNVKF